MEKKLFQLELMKEYEKNPKEMSYIGEAFYKLFYSLRDLKYDVLRSYHRYDVSPNLIRKKYNLFRENDNWNRGYNSYQILLFELLTGYENFETDINIFKNFLKVLEKSDKLKEVFEKMNKFHDLFKKEKKYEKYAPYFVSVNPDNESYPRSIYSINSHISNYKNYNSFIENTVSLEKDALGAEYKAHVDRKIDSFKKEENNEADQIYIDIEKYIIDYISIEKFIDECLKTISSMIKFIDREIRSKTYLTFPPAPPTMDKETENKIRSQVPDTLIQIKNVLIKYRQKLNQLTKMEILSNNFIHLNKYKFNEQGE